MRKPDIPGNKSPSIFEYEAFPHRPLETFGRKCFALFLIYPVYSLDSPDS